jgi:hypothetical protein
VPQRQHIIKIARRRHLIVVEIKFIVATAKASITLKEGGGNNCQPPAILSSADSMSQMQRGYMCMGCQQQQRGAAYLLPFGQKSLDSS